MATSPVAGQTYCASAPLLPVYPASTLSGAGVAATVITNQIYSLRYELGATKKILSTGAIAGIAVGGVAGVLLLSLAAMLCFRARQRRANKLRNATLPAIAAAGGSHQEFSPTKPNPGTPTTNIIPQIAEVSADSKAPPSELPSPPLPNGSPAGKTGFFSSTESPRGMITATGFVSPTMFPQELPGSSHMYEHHPAFKDATETPNESPPRTPAASIRRPDRGFDSATPFTVRQAGSAPGSPPRTPLPRSPAPPDMGQSSTPIINPLAAHPHRPDSPVLGHHFGVAK